MIDLSAIQAAKNSMPLPKSLGDHWVRDEAAIDSSHYASRNMDFIKFKHHEQDGIFASIRILPTPCHVSLFHWYFLELHGGNSRLLTEESIGPGIEKYLVEDHSNSHRVTERLVVLNLQPPWLYALEFSSPPGVLSRSCDLVKSIDIPPVWQSQTSLNCISSEGFRTVKQNGLVFSIPNSWAVIDSAPDSNGTRCVVDIDQGRLGRIDTRRLPAMMTHIDCMREYLKSVKNEGFETTGGLLVTVPNSNGFTETKKFYCRITKQGHFFGSSIVVNTNNDGHALVALLSPSHVDSMEWWAINCAAFDLILQTVELYD